MIRDCRNDTAARIRAHADLVDKRLLEVGCGPGRVTRMLADGSTAVVGIEPDPEVLREAVATIPSAGFVCASGMDLPFDAHSFDAVLYSLSLHHHPDCLDALAEAQRVVVPGGVILVLEPTPESEIQRLCKVFEDEDHRLTAVEEALPRCGLEVLSREVFRTHWEFADFEDVAEYGFTYYDHPPDREKRGALREFLDSRVHDAPIRMTDTLRLTCLRSFR